MRTAASIICTLVFSFLLLVGTELLGAGANIAIKVVDEATGAAVEDVALSAKGPVELRKLAHDGSWTFQELPAGTYELRAWAPGYAEKLGRLSVDTSQKTEYAGTVKLKRLSVEQAAAPVKETPKEIKETSPSKPADKKATPSVKDIAAKIGAVKAQEIVQSPESKSQTLKPAKESFMGISKNALGICAIILVFIIISDMVVFSVVTLAKWKSRSGLKSQMFLPMMTRQAIRTKPA